MATKKAATAIREYEGNDSIFLMAYMLAKEDVPAHQRFPNPTKRQWSKWKQGRGMAFKRKGDATAAAAK